MSAAVDLVIPNLDGEALLGACLEGVAAQTLAPARVIVVDSGSTDDSRAITEAHGAEWHELPANNGFAAAVNQGIAISGSPYVALLNNDAVAEPGWLAALAEALERDPGLSFAASRMLFTDERGMNAAGDAFDVRGRGGYNRGIREPDGPRFDEPRIVFGACAGAALYRRALFHDIGLFDERFFLSWEDVDLDLRAALAGHRCLYVPSAIVHHAQGASSAGAAWRTALERRNKATLALKSLPLPLLALYLVLLPAREAYETRAAREGVAGYLRRLAPYATEAPRALRHRGEVHRRLGLRELWPLLTRESLPYAPGPRERS